jgi:hypothetical protein
VSDLCNDNALVLTEICNIFSCDVVGSALYVRSDCRMVNCSCSCSEFGNNYMPKACKQYKVNLCVSDVFFFRFCRISLRFITVPILFDEIAAVINRVLTKFCLHQYTLSRNYHNKIFFRMWLCRFIHTNAYFYRIACISNK